MPSFLLGANDIPNDDEVVETVCYSRLTEKYIVDSFHDAFWAEHNIEPAAILFGSNNGVFRRFPGKNTEDCWAYDPRSRPWYTAASSPSKDVVLLIDISQNMANNNLQLAQAAAVTIINTLTVSDRVSVVVFSSEASVLTVDSVLQEGNIFIDASDENKKSKLIRAIEDLDSSNETSNLQNAFNVTFDIISNPIASDDTTPCNVAVVLLTDGNVDDGQSEEGTSTVISFIEEKQEELATNSSKRPVIFTYTVGDDANTSFAKRMACGTGGIWKHISNDESEDLFTALTSYYKVFAMGLANSEHDDFVAWIQPFFWYHDSKWGTTVTVPVYNRNATPYQLLGVAGVGIYMDSIERVLGSNATSWYLEWLTQTPVIDCPVIDPTECQLDALRFLGGGEDSTCGVCNNTSSYASFVSEQCPSNSTLPTDLWQNNECEFCLHALVLALETFI